MLRCVVAFGVVSLAAAQIDPRFAQNVTLYHVNPLTAGAIPVDMDTGDELGDLFFYLGQFLLPIECKNNPHGHAQFDCDNPERFGQTVVTKVVMEVDNRWTGYSLCNLCNGTDPLSHRPCKKGTYICDCPPFHPCDKIKVGRTEPIGGMWGCNSSSPDYSCWQSNIENKLGGYWFSTLKEGLCTASSPLGECGWRVLSSSTVNATCLDNSLMRKVEAAAPECFKPLGPRNSSSPAWIGCFMDTILGPEARHKNLDYSKKNYGMNLDDLVDAWVMPFLDETKGGCPKIPDPSIFIV